MGEKGGPKGGDRESGCRLRRLLFSAPTDLFDDHTSHFFMCLSLLISEMGTTILTCLVLFCLSHNTRKHLESLGLGYRNMVLLYNSSLCNQWGRSESQYTVREVLPGQRTCPDLHLLSRKDCSILSHTKRHLALLHIPLLSEHSLDVRCSALVTEFPK